MLPHQTLCHLIAILCLLTATVLEAATTSNPVLPEHGRALSLRVLQDRARTCQRTKLCEDTVTHLAFLRRIDGFVVDPEHNDLILVGQVDPTWPKLHLQDLVIALRDAWHLYGQRRGNTIYLSTPGVSIDPYPKVIKRLQEIGQALDSNSGYDPGSVLDAWHQVCHLPQQVRVMGIPYDTRFASVMLEVDYDLKRIADGSITLDIDGFQSLSSRHLEAAKQEVQHGSVKKEFTMSRFWFYPKPLKVQADDTAAVIEPEFGLKVLTEEEHLNARGLIDGKGKPNTLAGAFAQSLSHFMPQIVQARSTWRELENLAWMVALSRTVRYRHALEHANLNLNWLLTSFAVPDTQVPTTVPGHSNVLRYNYPSGHIIHALRLPSCGGVEMDIKINKHTFLTPDSLLHTMYQRVISHRPDDDVLYWDF